MAQKRMFSLNVVDSDNFLEMPISSRLLYYELGMRADDDGFVDSWKKILTFTGLKQDDMKILITKKFIIPFESGVIVIRHWRMNNYLQKDRTKPTIYQEELRKLGLDNNNVYTMDTSCIHSIDKNSIVKNNNISIVEQIISYMNELAGTKFNSKTKKTREMINARLAEGFTLDDFKDVIFYKYHEWYKMPITFSNGVKSDRYFRPNTLFGTKFEEYLQQYRDDTK